MRSRLPQDVYFVLMHFERWKNLLTDDGEDAGRTFEECRARITTNEDCWVVAPFIGLRARFENVYLSDRIVPNQVCVFSGVDVGIRARPDRCFSIAARSDGPVPELADLRIVQNRALVQSPRDRFIPHFPQPGLVPRSSARGQELRTLGFMGSLGNLYEPLRSERFRARLRSECGVEFVTNARGDHDLVANWFDYSEIDAVLALRDIGVEDVKVKPASKLVNAWLAGVPALLGPEPAFEELRLSELDYLLVRSEEDVIAAVKRLQSSPESYRAMVENGRKRGGEFDARSAVDRWAQLLSVDVPPLFRARFEHSSAWTRASRMVEFAARAVRFRRARAAAQRARDDPRRLLSD